MRRDGACSAKDVADAYGIPQEALAKILQRLVKAGLLHSQHGIERRLHAGARSGNDLAPSK